MNVVEDRVAAGTAALSCGKWAEARRHFEAALECEETPQALDGLSEALYWLDEVGPSLEHRTRAYALYCDRGDLSRAIRAALWLVWGHVGSYGNVAVGSGWLRRAERLLEEAGECVEQGWYEQFRSKLAPDAVTSAGHAHQAWEIARRYVDRDLELWALSQEGRARVSMGCVDDGMALLDEAVAAATAGEARSLLVVGDTCCNMLSACDRAADFDRAMQWCQVVDDFTRRHNGVPIFNYCRVVYSGVLLATGRWIEAENELRRGLRAVEKAHPSQRVYSLSRLALLCVRQGRLEEAAQFLEGLESQGAATEAMASLHLARGQAVLAGALLEKRLAACGDDLSITPLLGLLVEAQIQLGNHQAARSTALRFTEIANRVNQPPIQAHASLAMARAEAACDTPGWSLFENAIAWFEKLGMSFEAAVARLQLARTLRTGNSSIAQDYARLALSTFERLKARLHADQAAALLRDLGAGTRPGPRLGGDLTRREGEVLGLLCHGLSNVGIAKRLFISPKTVEHHVSRILSKLGLRNRAEAVAWALRNPSQKSAAK